MDSSTSGVTGTTRTPAVTLSHGTLVAKGNSGANSTDTISGALTIDGSSGYVDVVGVTPGTKNELLDIGSLARTNHGVALFASSNTSLGANSIVSQTTSSANIQITGSSTPTLVGGGAAAGTTDISILPWAIGQLGGLPSGTNSNPGNTFVTYTSANGFRPLASSEYDTTITDGNGAGSSTAQDNVELASGVSLSLTTGATINSLIMAGNGTLSGAGTLTVTSGAVLVDAGNTNTTSISCNLAFGAAEGVIGASYNRTTNLSGAISGTGGLTIYNNTPTSPHRRHHYAFKHRQHLYGRHLCPWIGDARFEQCTSRRQPHR